MKHMLLYQDQAVRSKKLTHSLNFMFSEIQLLFNSFLLLAIALSLVICQSQQFNVLTHFLSEGELSYETVLYIMNKVSGHL